MKPLNDILAWQAQQQQSEKKAGHFVLFHGPSVRDMFATAQLLGKEFGKVVHEVPLSKVISKYIGETEKNLAALFKKAEREDHILFFDEADVLFSKRTRVKDAHDKYANGEINYLLKRIEAYPGLVILATNLKENIDPAFIRHFHAILHIPKL